MVSPKYFTEPSKLKTFSPGHCSMGALTNPGSPHTADSALLNFTRNKHFPSGRRNIKVFSSPPEYMHPSQDTVPPLDLNVLYKQVNRFEEQMLRSEVVEYL